ncbi:MAG: hypothetical protein FJ090_04715 [Deltaproteobacteria bacterium]|nr:hypothetical protein [Deltaproteobacteria bacterium]
MPPPTEPPISLTPAGEAIGTPSYMSPEQPRRARASIKPGREPIPRELRAVLLE